MNNKTSNFIKSFSYTLSSNFISLVISILVTLIVPKLIGVEEYGFWQLYLFYSSYVGFLHFGWNDGIYLRYGGKEYKELDKGLFFSQFYMLVILQIIIASIIFFISNIFVADNSKLFILKMTAVCMLIVNMRYMLFYILQGTYRITEYAKITMIDRMIYISAISVFLLVGIRQYRMIILADILSKLVSLLYAMYCCRDIVFRNVFTYYFNFKETLENINVGIKLMFANIASILIIGVVRFGIERSWDVATFGIVSLALGISNFFMLFINAVGLVMFPILRRTDEKKLSNIYSTMRDFLMIILFGVLIVYYPFKMSLTIWLPKFADSFKYMAILFPMCVYEGKMALLINTYLKTLRKEKIILRVNLIALIFSITITFITTCILKDLDLAILSIVIILALRCILAESYLSKILDIFVYKDVVLELVITFIFIMLGIYVNSWVEMIIYGIIYMTYLFIKKKDIKNTIRNIKALVRI